MAQSLHIGLYWNLYDLFQPYLCHQDVWWRFDHGNIYNFGPLVASHEMFWVMASVILAKFVLWHPSCRTHAISLSGWSATCPSICGFVGSFTNGGSVRWQRDMGRGRWQSLWHEINAASIEHSRASVWFRLRKSLMLFVPWLTWT